MRRINLMPSPGQRSEAASAGSTTKRQVSAAGTHLPRAIRELLVPVDVSICWQIMVISLQLTMTKCKITPQYSTDSAHGSFSLGDLDGYAISSSLGMKCPEITLLKKTIVLQVVGTGVSSLSYHRFSSPSSLNLDAKKSCSIIL